MRGEVTPVAGAVARPPLPAVVANEWRTYGPVTQSHADVSVDWCLAYRLHPFLAVVECVECSTVPIGGESAKF